MSVPTKMTIGRLELSYEEFEDAKEVNRIPKSKDRQHNAK
jgi:hypothetical protein